MENAITSVRLNPGKPAHDYQYELDDQVPWHNEGFYLKERPSFTFDPIFHGGAYYVQEASSMLLAHVIKSARQENRPKRILDLCAAPGGKSTLIASMIRDDDLLVANEVIQSRFQILKENMTKWGMPNVILTNHDPKHFKSLPEYFDLVVIDAPCSGEGLWRKDPKAKDHWSDDHVAHCAIRQKRIIADILPSIKNTGHIIYSTCTFNDQENIDNISWACQEFNLQSIPVSLNSDWNVETIERNGVIGYQCRPENLRGEGFFISLLQKNSNKSVESRKTKTRNRNFEKIDQDIPWLRQESIQLFRDQNQVLWGMTSELSDDMFKITSALNRSQPVLEIGRQKKQHLIPAHALAMSQMLEENLDIIVYDRAEAIEYLRRSSMLPYNSDNTSDWILIEHNGVRLGWVKRTGSRLKNYYPMHWRIRK